MTGSLESRDERAAAVDALRRAAESAAQACFAHESAALGLTAAQAKALASTYFPIIPAKEHQ